MGGPFSSRPSAFISSVERSPTDPTGPRFRIEDIYPSIQGGRYAVKRIAGEPLAVWADIFRDGHDQIAASLRWRRDTSNRWTTVPMQFFGTESVALYRHCGDQLGELGCDDCHRIFLSIQAVSRGEHGADFAESFVSRAVHHGH